MGIVGWISRRSKHEDKLVVAPAHKGNTREQHSVRSVSHSRTRKQIIGRRKAMSGRKANVRRLVKARKPWATNR